MSNSGQPESSTIRVCNLDFDDPLDLGGCIPSRISATGTVLRGTAGAERAEGYGHGIVFERFSFARLQDE